MNDLIRRYGTSITALMCLLVAFWLVMLVIIPNITLFEQSFRPYLPVVDIGGPRDTYSLNNYAKVFDGRIEKVVLWNDLYHPSPCDDLWPDNLVFDCRHRGLLCAGLSFGVFHGENCQSQIAAHAAVAAIHPAVGVRSAARFCVVDYIGT
ncbi:MAG: hypothetical protein U5N55_05645 [Cypionkella sp.]|nr:hypothetical protein [Cypionkella sp.]